MDNLIFTIRSVDVTTSLASINSDNVTSSPIDISHLIYQYSIDALKILDRDTLMTEPRECSLTIKGKLSDLISVDLIEREIQTTYFNGVDSDMVYDFNEGQTYSSRRVKFLLPMTAALNMQTNIRRILSGNISIGVEDVKFPIAYEPVGESRATHYIPCRYESEDPYYTYAGEFVIKRPIFHNIILEITHAITNEKIYTGILKANGNSYKYREQKSDIQFTDIIGILSECLDEMSDYHQFNLDEEISQTRGYRLSGTSFYGIAPITEKLIEYFYPRLAFVFKTYGLYSPIGDAKVGVVLGNDFNNADFLWGYLSAQLVHNSGIGIVSVYSRTQEPEYLNVINDAGMNYYIHAIRGFYSIATDYIALVIHRIYISQTSEVLLKESQHIIQFRNNNIINFNLEISEISRTGSSYTNYADYWISNSDYYDIESYTPMQIGQYTGNTENININYDGTGYHVTDLSPFGLVTEEIPVFGRQWFNTDYRDGASIAYNGFNEKVSMKDCLKLFLLAHSLYICSKGNNLIVNKYYKWNGVHNRYVNINSYFVMDISQENSEYEKPDFSVCELVSNYENAIDAFDYGTNGNNLVYGVIYNLKRAIINKYGLATLYNTCKTYNITIMLHNDIITVPIDLNNALMIFDDYQTPTHMFARHIIIQEISYAEDNKVKVVGYEFDN